MVAMAMCGQVRNMHSFVHKCRTVQSESELTYICVLKIYMFTCVHWDLHSCSVFPHRVLWEVIAEK